MGQKGGGGICNPFNNKKIKNIFIISSLSVSQDFREGSVRISLSQCLTSDGVFEGRD